MSKSTWFYLSFANPDNAQGEQWLGCCLVDAAALPASYPVPRTPDPADQLFARAVALTHMLGINPGGEVRGATIPESAVPSGFPRNTLVTREMAKELGGFVGMDDGKDLE